MKVKLSVGIVAAVAVGLAIDFIGAGSANAAAQSANSTINGIVGSTITLSVSGDVTINVTPTLGGATATGAHTVTVGTNNSTGYDLKLSSSTTDTTLAKGADTFAAASGTFGAPAALAVNTWGYRLASFTASMYAGVVSNASPATIKTTATPVASDATEVTWAINATTAKPSGTYQRQVTYTATTRP